MRRSNRGRVAVLVAGGLALAGCASDPGSAAGDPGPGAPAVSADGIGLRELDESLRDFLGKVDERAAQGWPPEVKLSSDAPPRPQVRIEVTNRTSGRLDNEAWAAHISDRILDRGTLVVLLGQGPPDSLGDLRLACEVSEERQASDGVTTTDHWIHMKLADPSSGRALVSSRSRFRTTRER